MTTREIINRSIIIVTMGLIGYALAYAIYVKSFIGIVLAVIALGAAINFLYILAKAKEEMESQAAENHNQDVA